MSLSTKYQGRKVDLAIFPELTGEGITADARTINNPKVIAGLGKMTQNFARILLTPLGHYRSDPDFGSELIAKLVMNQPRFPSDVLHAFLIERDRVIAYMRANERVDAPSDERIKSANLVSQDVSGTGINLTIEVVSESLETVSFLLPVNWTL